MRASHGQPGFSLAGHVEATRTPGISCRARLNDRPPTKSSGRSSAPCLVQAVVVQPGCLADSSCVLAKLLPRKGVFPWLDLHWVCLLLQCIGEALRQPPDQAAELLDEPFTMGDAEGTCQRNG